MPVSILGLRGTPTSSARNTHVTSACIWPRAGARTGRRVSRARGDTVAFRATTEDSRWDKRSAEDERAITRAKLKQLVRSVLANCALTDYRCSRKCMTSRVSLAHWHAPTSRTGIPIYSRPEQIACTSRRTVEAEIKSRVDRNEEDKDTDVKIAM